MELLSLHVTLQKWLNKKPRNIKCWKVRLKTIEVIWIALNNAENCWASLKYQRL